MKRYFFVYIILGGLSSCYSSYKFKKDKITSNGPITSEIFIGRIDSITKIGADHIPLGAKIIESYQLININPIQPQKKKISFYQENKGYAWLHKNETIKNDTVLSIPPTFIQKNSWYMLSTFRRYTEKVFSIYAFYDNNFKLKPTAEFKRYSHIFLNS